jgi:hypothetical protein
VTLADSGHCQNIETTLNFWLSGGYHPDDDYPGKAAGAEPLRTLQRLPIFITEVNWDDSPTDPTPASPDPSYKGAYLVDLFTWLRDHKLTDPATSPLRVLWFNGANFMPGQGGTSGMLGLYGYGTNPLTGQNLDSEYTTTGQLRATVPSNTKPITTTVYDYDHNRYLTMTLEPVFCGLNSVRGSQMLSSDFALLLKAGCY